MCEDQLQEGFEVVPCAVDPAVIAACAGQHETEIHGSLLAPGIQGCEERLILEEGAVVDREGDLQRGLGGHRQVADLLMAGVRVPLDRWIQLLEAGPDTGRAGGPGDSLVADAIEKRGRGRPWHVTVFATDLPQGHGQC